jgi:hypothetical protein
MKTVFRYQWVNILARVYTLFVRFCPFGWRAALVRAFSSKDALTLLDVGGGTGSTMKIIHACNPNYYTINIDVSIVDLKESKKRNSHNDCVLGDVRKLPFRARSFDIVLVSNILEHLSKPDGLVLLQNLEAIAGKQITVAVPHDAGLYSSPDPENPHQAHVSKWSSSDFLGTGYQTRRFGAPWIRGESLGYMLGTKFKLAAFASSDRIFVLTLVFFIDDIYDMIGGFIVFPLNKGSILIATRKK